MPAVGSLETVMAQLLWMWPENFSLSSIDLLILFLVSELQIFPCHSSIILFLAHFLVIM